MHAVSVRVEHPVCIAGSNWEPVLVNAPTHAPCEAVPAPPFLYPFGHSVHADAEVEPVFGLYVPAGHNEQLV